MSNLTITVEAPELTAAILRLADVMKGNAAPTAAPVPMPPTPAPVVQEPIRQPAPVAPVQQAPAVPVTAPPAIPPAAPAYPTPAPTPAPAAPVAAAPAYTLDQLQVAIGPLMDAGKAPQLQGLLAKYGVQRMPDLRPDQLPAFAADLRGLGARI